MFRVGVEKYLGKMRVGKKGKNRPHFEAPSGSKGGFRLQSGE